MRLHRDKLPVHDVIFVLYYPDDGSDSADKLGVLASLAAVTCGHDEGHGGQSPAALTHGGS